MARNLAIMGKVIDCSKIMDKSQAQFAAQLKQNGIVLPEEDLRSIYETYRSIVKKQIEDEKKAAEAEKSNQVNKED